MGLTWAAAKAFQPRKSKYRNKKTVVDNIEFDSKREAAHYAELMLRFRAGEIQQLTVKPPAFHLVIPKKYHPDFSYYEDGQLVVVDVKGKLTREYVTKRKYMKLQHGVVIREVK